MSKKDLIKLIEKRQGLIQDVPDYFIKKLGQIQNNLYRELLFFVKELDTKGKDLTVSRFNIARANKLRTEVRQWLDKAGYYEQINVYGSRYGDLIKTAKEYYKELGFNPEFYDRDINTLSRIRKNDLNFLKSQEQNVIDTTYSTVMDSIYGKGDWQTLADRLKQLHTDTVFDNGKTLNGLLKKYSSTYANTAFAAFDRRIQNVKSQQYGIELFLYSGGTITDTREFCASRSGKVFTKKEIDGWNNMQWNGKIRGADVWAFLGGYNCQHILTPISEELARAEYGWEG